MIDFLLGSVGAFLVVCGIVFVDVPAVLIGAFCIALGYVGGKR